jgi:hypothetical protein
MNCFCRTKNAAPEQGGVLTLETIEIDHNAAYDVSWIVLIIAQKFSSGVSSWT